MVGEGRDIPSLGLDQEFMGSTGVTMARILQTHPRRDAAAAAQLILDENNAAAEKATKSGNPDELLMMSAPDEEFTRLSELLKKEGNADAQRLMRGLIVSRQIYKDNLAAPRDSNRERALLMKQTFMQDYDEGAKGSRPKVLMKFGDWHLYKGFNPLQNNDIGNFITELADGQARHQGNPYHHPSGQEDQVAVCWNRSPILAGEFQHARRRLQIHPTFRRWRGERGMDGV